jgi:nitroreductase
VKVEGEERVRVYHCPLAAEWLLWGDPALARLYCGVDQAKIKAFNPEYEYVHVRNILDGDPYCELAVRKIAEAAEDVLPDEVEKATGEKRPDEPGDEYPPAGVKWLGGTYSRQDLMQMDPACLRALFRERVHHTIEVLLYPILQGEKAVPPGFGRQPRLILDVWRERGFAEDEPDIEWGRQYIELAEKLCGGDSIRLENPLPQAFAPAELVVVEKLLRERRSMRDWAPGKSIPGELVERILEAGRAAPTACNLDAVRFVVIRDAEEASMVWSDIPTPMDRCVLIVVGYDARIYRTVGHDRLVPHNQLLDCAAAADHMCLMAHALGLGAVWLTRTQKTGTEFKRRYGLPDYIEPVLHIAVGWPAVGTIKSARMPLKYMRVERTQD